MTTATASRPVIQHRAAGLPNGRVGLWTLLKASLTGRSTRRLPLGSLDDHMLRDVGVDRPNASTDPRDLILRL
ncbi:MULTISPECIES: hypothetical protein [Inquilinus]|jgi:uncharacterized protein YjiS (DUF1127 family)|uniref:Uncharacterized protein YjiS (DUF1127 family) n=1 Tax=Inquilinus ginsengisoli TaxID=363840 RepID=A0ABU1JZ38_9PROT|nr:hypothetical protein [Inquilinus ginsengisoli]MDR6293890.1 uncharacterized protein YjiS (DUF1127 family) [Inquilinus ginsengisoli]